MLAQMFSPQQYFSRISGFLGFEPGPYTAVALLMTHSESGHQQMLGNRWIIKNYGWHKNDLLSSQLF